MQLHKQDGIFMMQSNTSVKCRQYSTLWLCSTWDGILTAVPVMINNDNEEKEEEDI